MTRTPAVAHSRAMSTTDMHQTLTDAVRPAGLDGETITYGFTGRAVRVAIAEDSCLGKEEIA